ncbi:MAG: hypothetical protein CL433_13170 [Acidimicrobiaceae bacterium]|nr:hypothetical protein [Acidimicrobiaceae bacterium]
MAIPIDYPVYGENEGEVAPAGGQVPVPSVESDTGARSVRQRFHARIGAFSELAKNKNKLVPILAGVAEELEVLRPLSPALRDLALAISGQDYIAADPGADPPVPGQPWIPGLIDYLSGWTDEDTGGTVPEYEGLMEESIDGFLDLERIRETIYGTVNPATGVKTDEGQVELVRAAVFHLAGKLVGALDADGVPTGADGLAQPMKNALLHLASLAGTVAADGTSAGGAGQIELLKDGLFTRLDAVVTKLDEVRAAVSGVESRLDAELSAINTTLGDLVAATSP